MFAVSLVNMFLKRLSVLAFLVAGILFCIQHFQKKVVLGDMVWAALFYFFLLSVSTWAITRSGLSKNNKTFITRTYSAIGIRFIFSIFPLAIYLFFYPVLEIPFIIAYVLLY